MTQRAVPHIHNASPDLASRTLPTNNPLVPAEPTCASQVCGQVRTSMAASNLEPRTSAAADKQPAKN
jgi:hypothetical protein